MWHKTTFIIDKTNTVELNVIFNEYTQDDIIIITDTIENKIAIK